MKLICAELGGEDCQFEAESDTKEEVKQKIWDHAKEVHPEKLEGMTEEQRKEVEQMMDNKLNEQEGSGEQAEESSAEETKTEN